MGTAKPGKPRLKQDQHTHAQMKNHTAEEPPKTDKKKTQYQPSLYSNNDAHLHFLCSKRPRTKKNEKKRQQYMPFLPPGPLT